MDEVLEQEIKRKAIKHIKDSFGVFGIEGTEDKIKELYANMEQVRDYMLSVYKELIWTI